MLIDFDIESSSLNIKKNIPANDRVIKTTPVLLFGPGGKYDHCYCCHYEHSSYHHSLSLLYKTGIILRLVLLRQYYNELMSICI